MKKILICLTFLAVVVSCKNTTTQKDEEIPVPVQKILEDSNIPVPELVVSSSVQGNNRVINITGRFSEINFNRYNRNPLGALTYFLELDFNKLNIVNRTPSSAPDLNFTFERKAPYSYTLTHALTGENFLIVIKDTKTNPVTAKSLEY